MSGRFAKTSGATPNGNSFDPVYREFMPPRSANNNDPFRSRPARPTFGTKGLPRGLVAIPSFPLGNLVKFGLQAADLIALTKYARDPARGFGFNLHPKAHDKMYKQLKWSCDSFTSSGYEYGAWDRLYGGLGNPVVLSCITGQAAGGQPQDAYLHANYHHGPITGPTSFTTIIGPADGAFDPNWWYGARFRNSIGYHTSIPAGVTTFYKWRYKPFVPLPSAGFIPNPNIQRGMPSPEPMEWPSPGNDLVTPPRVGFRTNGLTAVRFRPGPPARPKPGTRERKSYATAALLGVLDNISEIAEIVDAFYDALPEDVTKKWNRPGRGIIDAAGQYGIDGADWKLRALWHNWDKLDVEKAIKNVIKNEIQDKVLGSIHKNLPRNSGHANDPAFKQLNKILDTVFSSIGL